MVIISIITYIHTYIYIYNDTNYNYHHHYHCYCLGIIIISGALRGHGAVGRGQAAAEARGCGELQAYGRFP